jgi:hypothetical protein
MTAPEMSLTLKRLLTFVRIAASDIAWLAKLATGWPFNAADDFSHNLSKREIVERIEWRLVHLQHELENLRQRAEQEEPAKEG